MGHGFNSRAPGGFRDEQESIQPRDEANPVTRDLVQATSFTLGSGGGQSLIPANPRFGTANPALRQLRLVPGEIGIDPLQFAAQVAFLALTNRGERLGEFQFEGVAQQVGHLLRLRVRPGYFEWD